MGDVFRIGRALAAALRLGGRHRAATFVGCSLTIAAAFVFFGSGRARADEPGTVGDALGAASGPDAGNAVGPAVVNAVGNAVGYEHGHAFGTAVGIALCVAAVGTVVVFLAVFGGRSVRLRTIPPIPVGPGPHGRPDGDVPGSPDGAVMARVTRCGCSPCAPCSPECAWRYDFADTGLVAS